MNATLGTGSLGEKQNVFLFAITRQREYCSKDRSESGFNVRNTMMSIHDWIWRFVLELEACMK